MILLPLLGVTCLSGIFAFDQELENLAINGRAIQSSTEYSAEAHRAIDSNNNTDATKGHCTETRTTNNPWWRLDLRGNYAISVVRITNRRDCCSDRILGAQIRIGNSLENNGNSNRLCAIVRSIDPTITYACKGFSGRYVNIIVPGYRKKAAFCEVEVLGLNIALPEDAVSVPFGGAAFQSSIHYTSFADRAIDGNKSPDARHQSCSETKNSSDPWWSLDLEETYNVSVISITNRRDCCSERLLGAEIRVGNTLQTNRISSNLCGIVQSVSRTTRTFHCGGLLGRYVNIIQPGNNKILTLCEVEIFGSKVSSPEHAAGNVAFGRKAIQSNTNLNRVAQRAIDGKHIINGTQYTCSQTKSSKNPWWRVDLMRSYIVTRVKITNRRDCCTEQLSGAEIRVGDSLENNGNSNSLCGTVQSVTGTTTLGCDRFVGRYVNIIIPGQHKMLTLCEVEVFGTKAPSLDGAVSLTLGGKAIQSSTDGSATAERAIDGNKNPNARQNSCTQTKETSNPWWTVDLQGTYIVSLVTITNREDCCSERLLGAEVYVLNSFESKRKSYRHCGTVQSVSVNTFTFSCNDFMGRYVHIFISGLRKILTLCEVEVYGSESTSTEHTVNLAMWGTASQSSTMLLKKPYLAIDGNRNRNMKGGTCTQTRKTSRPWWRLDLKESYVVSIVRITNRMDCCSNRIVGAQIRIGNSLENEGNSNHLCATIEKVDTTYLLSCTGLTGRYVNIVVPGNDRILTLCEVEVFGTKLMSLEGSVNLAMKGIATQSSTDYSGKPQYAIDGIRSPNMRRNLCAHTRRSHAPWWRLDLVENYFVSFIRITNRMDCCSNRIVGAQVRIGNSEEVDGISNKLCATVQSVSQTYTFNCDGLSGRYVNIVLPGNGKVLTLCEVEVFGTKLPLLEDKELNLAMKGRANQSNSLTSRIASKVVDGFRTAMMRKNACTQIRSIRDPWWRLDLKGTNVASSVRIDMKTDCCSDSNLGTEIRIGNSLENNGNSNRLCATVRSVAKTYIFPCDGFVGRYVNIVLPGYNKSLNLCEVEFSGTRLPSLKDAVNLAMLGTATQSSTDNEAHAFLAIDGDTNSTAASNSCAHTRKSVDPWWRLDLNHTYIVAAVRITNRRDCCLDQLLGAEIRIGTTQENEVSSHSLCGTVRTTAETTLTFSCGASLGRYVSISIPGPDKVLSLCQIEVLGWTDVRFGLHKLLGVTYMPPISFVGRGIENVALLGTATQSSTDFFSSAVRAIDGSNNSNAKKSSCTQTKISENPWWRVDLKDNHIIYKVRITSRKDCCAKRIHGAEVHIGNSLENHGNSNKLCGILKPESATYTFDCEGFTGRYVNIVLPGRDKILELCEVEVFGIKAQSQFGAENVALWGAATQSSTDYGASAVRAIDGNKNSDAKQSSCTHTERSDNPWWRVDLKTNHIVYKVRITNRMDCCVERIRGAEVHIGNSLDNHGNSNKLCGIIQSISTQYTFDCDGFTGQYVSILLPGRNKILELCEVEVFGTGNVALWGTVTQSSTDFEAHPVRAIDGNNNSEAKQSSCTHTKKSEDPWWRVDLKANHIVSKVRITNRMDCCAERISGAEIHIGNSLENHGNSNKLCGIVQSVTANYTFDCDGFTGRYVNIMLPGRDKILEICKVEVFALRVLSQVGAENAALWGTAMQSSTDYGASAIRAIDGNNNSDAKQSSCTHTERSDNPWWRVDLKTNHIVSKVRITNRMDCCSGRISGAEIHIGNSLENHGNSNKLCGIIQPTSSSYTFDCDGFTGRYLNIILPGYKKILELCEVEVFGTANVALWGTATQSSTDYAASAVRAIDGNYNPDAKQSSCTHTKTSEDPWWRVDLKANHIVSKVRITSRMDCCAGRILGAEIYISNSLKNLGNYNKLCGNIQSVSANYTFDCDEFTGRYVMIMLPGRNKILELCEVEVFARKAPSQVGSDFQE